MIVCVATVSTLNELTMIKTYKSYAVLNLYSMDMYTGCTSDEEYCKRVAEECNAGSDTIRYVVAHVMWDEQVPGSEEDNRA